MKINKCRIRNFRGLDEIEFELSGVTNLIAGPNASGKSTVLEAIRLNKAALMPRYVSEPGSVLHSLGAAQNPSQLMVRGSYFDFSALAGDPKQPIEIELAYQITKSEISRLRGLSERISMDHLRGMVGNQAQQEQFALTQFLSSEQGQDQLTASRQSVADYLNELDENKPIRLPLTISPQGNFQGGNALGQVCLGILEKALPPKHSLFSYFPADRALPSGEAAVQLGSGDADQQIKSHLAEPALKYNRLKHSIANAAVLREDIATDVKLIFDYILPGKELAGIDISPTGALRVMVTESIAGRRFDIDGLSSGEKGLILTVMIMRRAMATGGIVMFDEPELHLNPAVCSKLLSFLIDQCYRPNDLQAIICTHSASILNNAYEREDCSIIHLKSPTNATPILRGDTSEMQDALNKLGVSPAESLFYEGTIFLEGSDDVDLIREGFGASLSDRIQLTDLGGRESVESQIRSLQKLEADNQLDRVHRFVFDRDRNVTELRSSNFVKIAQWERYCIENYLLDLRHLYDVIKSTLSEEKARNMEDRGAFNKRVKEFAMEQLIPIVAREAYVRQKLRSPGLKGKVEQNTFDQIASTLSADIEQLKQRLESFDNKSWQENYIKDCNDLLQELRENWESSWQAECNGKILLSRVCDHFEARRPRLEIKKEIMRRIREEKSSEWTAMRKTIDELMR